MQRRKGRGNVDWHFFSCITNNRKGCGCSTGMYIREPEILNAVKSILLKDKLPQEELAELISSQLLDVTIHKNGQIDAKWSAVTILRILKDKTYTGTLVQGKQHKLNYKLQKNVTRPSAEWVRCSHAHEAIISLQDFETVQRILLLDTRASPSCDYVNLFSGLLICGSCQSNMTRKMVRHEDIVYRYYYCPTGKRRGCVAPTMISEDTLKEIVFNEIRHYTAKRQTCVLKITDAQDILTNILCNNQKETRRQLWVARSR